jgi:methionyl aminopeptidase
MVNQGGPEVFIKPDGWTVCTEDGSLSAYFEHTVAVTRDAPMVLTALRGKGLQARRRAS